MSETPETDAAELIYDGIVASGYADANVCRKLERERDKAQALVAEMKQAIIWAKAEAKERLHRLDQAACERRTWLEAHEKMKRERDEAREAFSIATSNCVDAQQRLRDMERELKESMEALREIQAADWKTAGELRGMARRALEAAK